jgi:acyl-CoA thioesterase
VFRPGFETDTAVEPLGGGGFRAHVSTDWYTPRGPNGGYLAAIVLRAILASEPDSERAPRSLTLHYLRPPAEGEVRITVTEERRGRSLTTLSARLEQDGKLCILALGALSLDFPTALDYAERMPAHEPLGELVVPSGDNVPAIASRFATGLAVGSAPFSGGEEAATGGWIAFAGSDPSPLDPVALALLSDAWMPAPFVRMHRPVGAPTIDLTIHFRARSDGLTGPALAVFRSRTSAEGFFEEDGELWSKDGILLAQSRQLALLTP